MIQIQYKDGSTLEIKMDSEIAIKYFLSTYLCDMKIIKRIDYV